MKSLSKNVWWLKWRKLHDVCLFMPTFHINSSEQIGLAAVMAPHNLSLYILAAAIFVFVTPM